jgi:arginine repressor
VASHVVGSQEELRQLLTERGMDVTQATLSRDLRDLHPRGFPKRAARDTCCLNRSRKMTAPLPPTCCLSCSPAWTGR